MAMTPDTPDPNAAAAPPTAAAAPPTAAPDPNSLLGRFQTVAAGNPAPGATPVPPHTDSSTNKPPGAAPPPPGPPADFLDRFNQVAKTGSSVSAAEAAAKAAAAANLQRHLQQVNTGPFSPAGQAEKEMSYDPDKGGYQTNKEQAMDALQATGSAAAETAAGVAGAEGIPALLESGWAKGPLLDAAGNAVRNAKGQMLPWVDQETDSLLMKAGKATYEFAKAHPLATVAAVHVAHELGIPLTKYIDFLAKATKEP